MCAVQSARESPARKECIKMTEKEKIIKEYVMEQQEKARAYVNKVLDPRKDRLTDKFRAKGALVQSERFIKVIDVAFAENIDAEKLKEFIKSLK